MLGRSRAVVLGVDPVPRRHDHAPVTGAAAQPDEAILSVIGRRDFEDRSTRIDLGPDVVTAVRQTADVEPAPVEVLAVGVAPPYRDDLSDPEGAWLVEVARALEILGVGVPVRVRDREVDRVCGHETPGILRTDLDRLLVGIQQRVPDEVLEMPVIVAPRVVLELTDQRPPYGLTITQEVLVRIHRRLCIAAEAVDNHRPGPRVPFRRVEVEIAAFEAYPPGGERGEVRQRRGIGLADDRGAREGDGRRGLGRGRLRVGCRHRPAIRDRDVHLGGRVARRDRQQVDPLGIDLVRIVYASPLAVRSRDGWSSRQPPSSWDAPRFLLDHAPAAARSNTRS